MNDILKSPDGSLNTAELRIPVQETFDVTRGKHDGDKSNAIKDRNWNRNTVEYTNILNFGEELKRRQELHKRFKTINPIERRNADEMVGRRHKGARSLRNTSLGGNFAINTHWGYTPTADVDLDRFYDKPGDPTAKMGRYYYESIEQNAHDIHLRFGVQKFNSGLVFFGDWFDYHSFSIGTKGRAPSFLYEVGQITGLALGFTVPALILIGYLTKLAGLLLNGSRFWYINPTMALYWTAVTNIFNQITAGLGMTLPTNYGDAYSMMNPNEKPLPGTERDMTLIGQMAAILPGIYENAMGAANEGFSIDIRRVISRASATENQLNHVLTKKIADYPEGVPFTTEVLESYYDEAMQSLRNYEATTINYSGKLNKPHSTRTYLQEYLNTRSGKADTFEAVEGKTLDENDSSTWRLKEYSPDEGIPDADSIGGIYNSSDWHASITDDDGDDIMRLAHKELMDGSSWLTLRVDGTKSISESFGNSSETSKIASMINGWAETRKNINFNLAGGALLGDTVKSALGAVEDFAQGNLDMLGLSGVGGFIAGAKIDIANTWGSSNASLPRASYSLKLVCPYPHPLMIAQDLYLPLACILAGVLPISSGRNSYTQPFFCEVYDRGRCLIKNGIISNVNITRGDGGIPWTHEGLPTAIQIDFEIENLDTTIHMPINTGSTLNPFTIAKSIIIGNESALNDYVSVLTGASLTDMIYRTSNIRRNLYTFMRQWNSYWDRDHWIQRLGQSAPGNFLRQISYNPDLQL